MRVSVPACRFSKDYLYIRHSVSVIPSILSYCIYRFVEPLIEIAMEVALYEANLSGFCFGDFQGMEFDDYDKLDQLGCSAIPMAHDIAFGTIAGQLSIGPLLQDALVPLSLWTNKEEDVKDKAGRRPFQTVTPNFCMGIRAPTTTCDVFTFGMSVNDGAIDTLRGVLPAAGVGDALVTLVTALNDQIEKKGVVTFAMSFGDGLDVPVKYYVDRTFVQDNLNVHVFFGYSGPIDLSMVMAGDNSNSKRKMLKKKKKKPKDIVTVMGKYKRGFNFGKSSKDVEQGVNALLDSTKLTRTMSSKDVMKHVESVLGTYPEVVTTAETVVVDLEDVTQGLLKGFNVSGTIIHALKLTKTVGEVKPGFYMTAQVNMGILKGIANGICDDLNGALKAVSGKGCPNLDEGLPKDGKLGLELRKAAAELLIEWKDFFLRCHVREMNAKEPEMSCQINSVVVGIHRTTGGFEIGKAHALTGKLEEKASVVSEDSVKVANGFGKQLSVSVKLSAASAEKLFNSVSKFFGGKATGKREDASFNFQEKSKCKKSIRLWNSRDPRDYKKFFSQAGNDDSKASCFESCYLWSQKKKKSAPPNQSDMCCSYEVLNPNSKKPKGECRVGGSGKEKTNDKRKSATVTFLDDYNRMSNLPSVGARCSKDEQCFSGFCHNGYCKNECDKKNKCFPMSWSKCFGDDKACIDVNGIPHLCDKKSDSCKCDKASKRCEQNVLPEVNIGLLGGEKLLWKKQKQALKKIKEIAASGANEGHA